MKPKPYRIEVPHAPDCGAVREVEKGCWESPWACLADDPHVFASAWGTGRGYRYWLRFRCNNLRCPGVLRVRADAVLAIAKEAR